MRFRHPLAVSRREDTVLKPATVTISIRGDLREIPAVDVDGRLVIVDGRLLRLARVHDEHWLEDDLGDLPSFLEQIKSGTLPSCRIDAFTFLQKLPDIRPRYGFPMLAESVAAIPITSYQNWMDSLPRDARTDVRKAEKRGVTLRTSQLDDEFVLGIVDIYNESPIRQGKRFWHHGKEIDAVRTENSTYADRSTFLGAYLGTELVGFMKIVRVGQVGAMMQILAKISYRDHRVSNGLVAAAVRFSEQQKWQYLTYGQYRYRNRENSLTRFKHRSGFKEYLLPRYFVPLNRRGKLCLGLGLHRHLADRVPPGLVRVAAYLRAQYQQRMADHTA